MTSNAPTPSALFICGAALCAGAGLGFFAGSEKSIPAERAPVQSPAAQVQQPGNSPNSRTAPSASPGAGGVPEPAAESRFRDESDPAQTLARLRAETNPNRRRREMDELCAALDVPRLKAFLAAVDQKSSMLPFERWIIEKLMGRWAEIDPPAAADYAVRKGASRDAPGLYDVMRVWAASDPAAARQWALGAKDRQARQFGVNAITSVLAEHDPQAALSFLEELPPTENKTFYIYGLFYSLSRNNPAQAAKLAPQLASRNLRQTAVGQVASAWAEREPEQALGWFLQNTSSQTNGQWSSEQILGSIMKSWVRAAPEEAAAFATELPPGASRSAIISSLGASWGAVNPEAAAAWLQTLPKSAESIRAFGELIGSWTKSDPARAGAFLIAQPADRMRDDLLQTLGGVWTNENPAAALAWARQHSDPAIERFVAAEALGAMAAKDLPNADSYLAQLKTPAAVTAAISGVVNKLMDRDSETAARWVMQRPETQPIGRAIEWPVQSWADENPEAVGTWLNEQPASTRKDAAVSAYAGQLAQKDGEAAALWANTITDAGARRTRVKSVVGTWAKKDGAAARAWVAGQRFPAAEQQELQQVLDRTSQK